MQQVFFNNNQGISVSNIFCIGRNYAAHISELGNKPSDTPLVFLKPTSALNITKTIQLPAFSSEIDYETELVLLIGRSAKNLRREDAWSCISGYGVGLDLTARDLQALAKKQGLPWTLAKGFDDSATVSSFIPANEITDPQGLSFQMTQNGILRQQGFVNHMLFDIPYLIEFLSTRFSLQPGDLIFTGTPEGTGRIQQGDRIEIELADKLKVDFSVLA
ncbi:Homoprotocatechuate catabolism bifunctional isomerase/decarboxylase [Legionella massiliensis]|uniref:Homoprotocatechuate catabolism bifunctional isomerase/decarboxylase n=1 Tax=Legionella massiliensis TaxID=1034943 RepID=A0A078KU58_9GAMM|nr:fumarylacetoacetate hydrolase family protein [Legionella massiliensis]CDZ76512.1 Homoprotocatechuate catabolism bifunctional isomerase/decarboxylase [Legionella massiliensis]CEE12250.1 Fumarylpyruvate hydrolase [Legionella massiliensis]